MLTPGELQLSLQCWILLRAGTAGHLLMCSRETWLPWQVGSMHEIKGEGGGQGRGWGCQVIA